MAWIKLEKDLYTDPRVRRMATELRARDGAAGVRLGDPLRYVTTCVGALAILWITADTHVQEDDTLALGPAEIDQLTGIDRFCELLPGEWLQVIDAHRVKLPGFHRHNGTTAKRRAQGAKRQVQHRLRLVRDRT
jgi:hypothetical protein